MKVWSSVTEQIIFSTELNNFNSFDWSPSKPVIAFAKSSELQIYNVETKKMIKTKHIEYINTVKFSGNTVISFGSSLSSSRKPVFLGNGGQMEGEGGILGGQVDVPARLEK